MLLRLLGIIAFIYVICVIVKKLYEQDKRERREKEISAEHTTREKFREDCRKKRDSVRDELRQKYYSSSVTREIADYFLAGKQSSPLNISSNIHSLKASYADGTSIIYIFLEHGLPNISYSERVDPPYAPPYTLFDSDLSNLEFHPQHEFCDALRQVISEQYGIDYAFDELYPGVLDPSYGLHRVPTRQF